MVDTDCVAAGQGVPKDETHLHFGQGQLEAELDLKLSLIHISEPTRPY